MDIYAIDAKATMAVHQTKQNNINIVPDDLYTTQHIEVNKKKKDQKHATKKAVADVNNCKATIVSIKVIEQRHCAIWKGIKPNKKKLKWGQYQQISPRFEFLSTAGRRSLLNSNRKCVRLTMQGSRYRCEKAPLLYVRWMKQKHKSARKQQQLWCHRRPAAPLNAQQSESCKCHHLSRTPCSSCLLYGRTCLRSVSWLLCHYSSAEGSAPSHHGSAHKPNVLLGGGGGGLKIHLPSMGIESTKSPGLSVLFCTVWVMWSMWLGAACWKEM